ncbi:MAG: acyl carrier protein [Planctomycetota bacterium]|nr:MAG: acyl carrier protein [Planctomycetota bacterium]
MHATELTTAVRRVILDGVLRGNDAAALQDTTPLLTSGVLDSVRVVTLISDLEKAFGVSFEAHEMSVDYLDSIAHIARTIAAKQGA